MKFIGFSHGFGMARRVLLLLASMLSVGCIIPPSLKQAEQPPNFRPVFVASAVAPKFGPINLPDSMDRVQFSIAVEDPNLDDILTVRLFRLNGDKRFYTGLFIELDFPTVADPMNPTRRVGRFAEIAPCQVFSGVDTPLFAIVADEDFSTKPTEEDTAPGGLTDENHWELDCP
jgi:hypothetical protein